MAGGGELRAGDGIRRGRCELERSEGMKGRGAGQRGGVLVGERGRARGDVSGELGAKRMRSQRPALCGHGA